MNKMNRIRLFFLIGTFFCISGYYYGYHQITGLFPDEIQEQQVEPVSEINVSKDTTSKEAATETSKQELTYDYVIVDEDGYLTVYEADLKTIYMYTDIKTDDLEKNIRKEIKSGKKITDIESLYSFLENYSS